MSNTAIYDIECVNVIVHDGDKPITAFVASGSTYVERARQFVIKLDPSIAVMPIAWGEPVMTADNDVQVTGKFKRLTFTVTTLRPSRAPGLAAPAASADCSAAA